jgi:tetratricopeptide (TPR) repeat protein
MIARHLGCDSRGRESIARRAREQMRADPAGADPAEVARLASMLAEQGPAPPLEQQHITARRWLERCARRRPMVLWLDDLQWGRRTLEFLAYLLEDAPGLDVLVVATVRTDAPGVPDGVRRSLDELWEDERAVNLEIEPLGQRAQRRLVETMLGLHPELAERVCARSEGNPFYATQLVGDWVHRKVLVLEDEGFALARDEDAALPATLHALCFDRIERALEGLDADTDESMSTLEIAAAQGRSVDAARWRRACARIGREVPEGIVDRLVAAGVATRERDGWSFTHGMLAESLERVARATTLWRAAHDAYIEQFEGASRFDLSRDRAGALVHHLIEAGRLGEAVEMLRSMFVQFDPGEVLEYVERLDARLRDDVEATLEQRLQCHLIECLSLSEQGAFERCEELLNAIEEQLPDPAPASLVARYNKSRAWVELHRRRFDRCAAAIEAAFEAVTDCSEPYEEADVRRVAGNLAYFRGAYDEAIEHFTAAADIYEGTGLASALAWTRYELAMTCEEAERFEACRAELGRAMEVMRRLDDLVGQACCLTVEAALADRRGDHERAAELTRRSIVKYRAAEDFGVYVGLENLGRILLSLGEHDEARRALAEVREAYRGGEMGLYANLVDDALLLACALAGDWEGWDDYFESLLAEDDEALADPLVAETCLRAAEAAIEAGARDRARDAVRLAFFVRGMVGGDETREELVERARQEWGLALHPEELERWCLRARRAPRGEVDT